MKQKALTIISVLFGLMFINAGLNKFFNYMPVPDNLPEAMVTSMNSMMEIGWLIPLVAVVEIIGGILFFFGKVRALGAIVIFPVMIGIIFTHIYSDPATLIMPLVLMAINIWVIVENRQKVLPMIGQ